jgi:hypothetical protein
MKSKFFSVLVLVLILASSVMTVWAGLHFSGGAGFGSGSVRINVRMVGIAGGRSTNVTATITDGYNLTAVCRNVYGYYEEGDIPVNITNLSLSKTVQPNRNGNAHLNWHVDIIEEAGITWEDVGCPSSDWVVTDLLGHININIHASNGRFNDTLHYSCFVSDVDQIVECAQS